jgi:hypothetical protein
MIMPRTPKGDNADNDMQAVGHQIGSLASVLVVAAVQLGIPLTPGQQSSILSVIAVAWALFATIYGIRHRIPRRARNDPNNRTQPPTTPIRVPRSPNIATGTPRVNGTRRRATGPMGIDDGRTDQPESGKVP